MAKRYASKQNQPLGAHDDGNSRLLADTETETCLYLPGIPLNMEKFNFKELSVTLKDNPDAKHLLFTYASQLFTYLCNLKIEGNEDTNKKAFDEITSNLNDLVDFYNQEANLDLSVQHLSINLDKLIAKDYILSFSLLKYVNNSSLFDTANKLITLVIANDKRNTLFTGSSTVKLINKQLLAIVILQHFFDTYGYDLTSLAPILIQYCYKSIKTIAGSSKTLFSSNVALTELTILLVKILRNNGVTTLDDSIHSKLLKVVKQLIKLLSDTKDVKNYNTINGVNLPIVPIANAFEILCHLIEFEKKYSTINAKTHKDKNLFVNQLSKEYTNYFLMGFSCNHKVVRQSSAKALGELFYKNLFKKNISSLDNVLSFFTNIYLSNNDITVRSTVFVSLTHFLTLNDVQNRGFLYENFFLILDNIKGLVSNPLLSLENFNNNKTFSQIYWFYEKYYLKSLGQFNKTLVLQKLIDSEYLNNEPLLLNNPVFVQVLLKLLEFLIKDLGPTVAYYQEQLKLILLKLVGDRNFQVRIHAVNAFVFYCQNFPNQIQSILNYCLSEIQTVFRKVTQVGATSSTTAGVSGSDAEKRVEPSHIVTDFSKIHGYANCIAFLIKIIDKDYVSQDVIARTLTFASSQLKSVSTITSSNLLGNNNDKTEKSLTEIKLSFNKRLISWTLLTGLMNVDESFLKIHISQFFIFWKNLLTHNYQSTFGSSNGSDLVKLRMEEVFRNLEIRNYAVTCLLNFLNNVSVTPEISKQSSFLLTKCLSYVNSLEANLNKLTGKEREDIYNNEKEAVILLHKKRILQCYIKLSNYLKNDLNSSILIFALKNFSNPEIFNEEIDTLANIALKDKERDKEKELKAFKSHLHNDKQSNSVGEDLNNHDLYLVNDGLSYGLSSKLKSGFISELSVKYSKHDQSAKEAYKTDIDIEDIKVLPDSIEGKDTYSHYVPVTWVDKYEEQVLYNPFTALISNDYLLKVYDESYSSTEEFSYGLNTSIIDLSIEIFSLVFPYLSSKIQQSLLEQMRGNLLSKKASRLRVKAIIINAAIAIHGLLSVCRKNSITLESNILPTLMETLKTIDLKEPFIFQLNANSISLLSSQFPNISERTNIHINDIVENNNPFTRAADVLIISDIYKYNSLNFNTILDVILSLTADPHPVVHYWSLYSLVTLVESHLSVNNSLGSQILEKLEAFLLNDHYTIHKSSNLTSNFSLFFQSDKLIARLVRSIILSLGPNVRELKPRSKELLSNLLMSFLFVESDPIILQETLKSIQNLMIFDKNAFSLKIYIKVLNYLLKNNLKSSIGSYNQSLPIFNDTNEVFPTTSSHNLLNRVLSCYFQLIKIFPVENILERGIKQFLWICVDFNPDFKDLQLLIRYWLESSIDIKWFTVLNTLYRIHRNKLYDELYGSYKATLTKHNKKTIRVDIQDEEIESMAKGAESADGDNHTGDADGTNSNAVSNTAESEEPSSHKFKLFVLELIQLLLSNAKTNFKLYQQFQPKIQELVKVSFSASTSSIMSLRLVGISILGDIITIYADAKDQLYDSVSLLEQQQAQITAALTPAFTSDSSTILASEAINVCAKFVGSNIVSVDRCGRILRILVTSLEEFSSQGEPKIGEVEILTLRGNRRIKLSVLNAWAELKIYSKLQKSDENSRENSEQISALVDKYLEILVPMWILALREYSSLKYGNDIEEPGDKEAELQLYEACWINFVDVIGCIIEEQGQLIYSLLENDANNFFFVLFAQCIEVLIKPSSIQNSTSLFSSTSKAKNNYRVLAALNKLLHSKISSDIIFQDQVFAESIDLFDRLILVSDDEEKLVIIDIISGLFLNYFNLQDKSEQDFTDNIGKLFELLRVIMISIVNIIPFIGDDYAGSDVGKTDFTPTQITILKKSFSALVNMIEKFPVVMEVDLFSSLLYVFSLIYLNEEYRDVLVPIILSNIKQIITSLNNHGSHDLVNYFYQLIRPSFTNSSSSILTIMVFITSAGNLVNINTDDINLLVDSLVASLLERASLPVGIQSIKSLILYATKSNSIAGVTIIKKLIPSLVKLLVNKNDQIEDPRVIIEMIVLYSKQFSEKEQLVPIFTIIIPLICWYDEKLGADFVSGQFKQYLHDKLLNLLNLSSEGFKVVVNEVLSTEQKSKTENLVKFDISAFNSRFSSEQKSSQQSHIQLKMFGS